MRIVRTVIVLHGVKGNRTSVVRYAITLCNANFNVLLFDWRAHGESDGKYVTYGYYERQDVEAAMDFLKNESGLNCHLIGLAGLSMGAAVALQVAAIDKQIRAVWADSPFASLIRVGTALGRRWTGFPESMVLPFARATFKIAAYRAKFDPESVNPLNIAKEIICPVALVHGTEDKTIPYDHSQAIYDLLGSQQKELWIIEGAEHTNCIRRGGNYQERMVDFFNAAFLPRSESSL